MISELWQHTFYVYLCTALFSQLTIASYVLVFRWNISVLRNFFTFWCRYAIVHGMSLKRLFSINAQNGTIIITKPLDREITAWHNITVTATEASQ